MSDYEPTITYDRLLEQLRSMQAQRHNEYRRYMQRETYGLAQQALGQETELEDLIRVFEGQRQRLLAEHMLRESARRRAEEEAESRQVRSIKSVSSRNKNEAS